MSRRSEQRDEIRQLLTSMNTRLEQLSSRMDRIERRSHSSRTHNRRQEPQPVEKLPTKIQLEPSISAENTKEECTKSIPAANSCVTPQGVVRAVLGEEPSLLLVSKEEGIDQQTSRNIRPESPIEFPPRSPTIHEDDRAIVPYQPTHPVVPKQLRQHLVQRGDWPRIFLTLKEFPQLGNSILAIQVGESVRVLQYLNDGTNNFEFLAEIQVLPTLGTNNSSMIVNNTEEMREDPFREGRNDEVISSPIKVTNQFVVLTDYQMLSTYFTNKSSMNGNNTEEMREDPFREGRNDEVISSSIKVTNRPTGIEFHLDLSKSLVTRNLELKVIIELKVPQKDPSMLLDTRSLYIDKIDCVKI